jgi:DNA polymerase I
MSDYSNDLIFGKDKTENVVSVEVKDDVLTIFKEKDGVVSKETRGHKFWLLNSEKRVSRSVRLEGDQHYKYLVQFDDYSSWMKAKTVCKKSGWDYWTVNESKEHALIFNGITYFKEMKPKDVSVLFFDIEGTGLTHNADSQVLAITNVYRNGKGEIQKVNFFLDEYEDNQADMLLDWCDWVKEVDPSIVVVHNGFGYDLPYLQHVADLHNVRLVLGRNSYELQFAPFTSQFRKDGSQSYEYSNCWIYGREIVDSMFLSVKYDFAREFPSYALKSIIKHLGLEKPGRTIVDAGKIGQYYRERKTNPEMWNKVKTYAIEDSEDLVTLYDLMIPSFFYFAQQVSKSLQQMINSATGSQINNMMVRSYLQENHSIAKAEEKIKFPGGLSYGVPGLYRNVYKLDVSSLYPSIIRQYKIYNKQKDPKANFLNIVDTLTIERLKNKKLAKETGDKYYSDLEGGQKIGINSMYGAMGTPGLNYNYMEGANLTTEYGRQVLNKGVLLATGKTAEEWMPEDEETEDETTDT